MSARTCRMQRLANICQCQRGIVSKTSGLGERFFLIRNCVNLNKERLLGAWGIL